MYSKKIIIAICYFFSIALFAQDATKLSLDGNWSFKIDPEYQGESLGFEKQNFDASNWDKMEVPGNWNLHNLYSEYSGDAWYTCTINSSEITSIRYGFSFCYNYLKYLLRGWIL